jgi:hypothetical protein
MLRKILSFFGFGGQAELFKKTIGKTLSQPVVKKDDIGKIWWACKVIADRIFPSLQDKRLFGKIHIGGLIMALIASTVPALLIARLYHRMYSWTQKVTPKIDSQGEENGNRQRQNQRGEDLKYTK